MRVNSYNKFFAEVAKIMNTEVKSVKQLDDRYKVELSNHVYLNIYRGVLGSLFVHDHRGIAHITSCYDFDDFKTMKDLYERLTKDYSESSDTVKDVMEVKQELNTSFGKKEQQYFDTDCLELNNTIIENINYCPNQNTCCIVSPFVDCDYNYKSDNCIKAHKNFINDCEQVHKQMKAINNPNWHHVSLLTLENIDMDMTSEKWQTYIHVYRDLQQKLSYLRKCKTQDSYDSCIIRYIKRKNDMWAKGKITIYMLNYIEAKLSMENVESGTWSSSCEQATGYHKSRRYNKSRAL